MSLAYLVDLHRVPATIGKCSRHECGMGPEMGWRMIVGFAAAVISMPQAHADFSENG